MKNTWTAFNAAPSPLAWAVFRLLILTTGLVLTVPHAFAPPADGANCRACHGTVQSGMYLTGNQSTTNLGDGLLKVYRVTQGQTAAIGIQLTNRYGSTYGLSLLNLEAPGYAVATNRLVYSGDTTWTSRTDGSLNYFTVGPSSGTFPLSRTNNLVIQSNTPPDLYKVQMQMAGPANGEWSQVENFYLQVLPAALPPANQPQLTGPVFANGQFSVTTPTQPGYTYYLEYKTDLTNATWTGASQVPGDGAAKVLTNAPATGPQRFYRVRVQ
jgi:hypothetical protein